MLRCLQAQKHYQTFNTLGFQCQYKMNEQYLDNSVPSSRYNDGITGVWREPYTGHPLSVSLILLVDKRQRQFEYECLG